MRRTHLLVKRGQHLYNELDQKKRSTNEGLAYEKDIRFILENQCIQKAFYRDGLFYYSYVAFLPCFSAVLFYHHMGR